MLVFMVAMIAIGLLAFLAAGTLTCASAEHWECTSLTAQAAAVALPNTRSNLRQMKMGEDARIGNARPVGASGRRSAQAPFIYQGRNIMSNPNERTEILRLVETAS